MANEDKDDLVPVEDTDLDTRQKAGPDDEAGGDEDGHEADDTEDGEVEGDTTETDARAGHAEGEEEGEDASQASRRQERQARKQRQREARERSERELNFLRMRNEQLEKRFSAVEQRQRRTEVMSIDQQIAELRAKITEAEEVEADAIKSGEGSDAVEARNIREALEREAHRLTAHKEAIKKAPQPGAGEVPLQARLAIAWIRKNQSWYKPDGSDEDSAIVQAIENSMAREGHRSDTPEYWTELDRRVARRLPHVAGGGKTGSGGTDTGGSQEINTRKGPDAPARKAAGPKVSVGGQQRHLKPNEVYVSPERKNAMVEAGVWDDPVLRAKYLRQYQAWDKQNSNS